MKTERWPMSPNPRVMRSVGPRPHPVLPLTIQTFPFNTKNTPVRCWYQFAFPRAQSHVMTSVYPTVQAISVQKPASSHWPLFRGRPRCQEAAGLLLSPPLLYSSLHTTGLAVVLKMVVECLLCWSSSPALPLM